MKTMITFEFFALILVIWAYIREQSNQWNITYSNGGWTKHFNFNPLTRIKNYYIALFALSLSFAGILVWIWTTLP